MHVASVPCSQLQYAFSLWRAGHFSSVQVHEVVKLIEYDVFLQGCLEWHEQALLEPHHFPAESLDKSCDSSNHNQHPQLSLNKVLVFNFANPVISRPQFLDADCTCAQLLKIPAHSHYKDAFMAQCTSFQLPGSLEEKLLNETEEQSRLFWQSLPNAVRNNPQWWV